jgi:hypothetical protein
MPFDMDKFRNSLESDEKEGKLNIDPSHEKKLYIIETIKTLTKEEQQLFYNVMKFYNTAYENPKDEKMIYNGRQVSQTKYAFNLIALPIRLRNILFKFCKLIRNN